MRWEPLVNTLANRVIDAVGESFRKKPKVPESVSPEDYFKPIEGIAPLDETPAPMPGAADPPGSPQKTQELRLPPRTLTSQQCIACLAHNHYLAARGRIKEAIKFHYRAGGFDETVIEKLHDVMEDLITPDRDDYAAKSDSPVLNEMLRDMQRKGDAIKKDLEAVLLDYENKGADDLESIKQDIVDIQKAAWKLTGIEKNLAAGGA